MFLALLVGGLVVALVVGALFVFGLRRRLIQRSGGTFDCSLRWNIPEETDLSGKGWVYGVARYNSDRIMWFRVFSYALRPRRVLERSAIEVVARRTPEGEEELALLSDAVVLGCLHRGTRLELAMSEDALTGFLAWLEAAPPGQRVNVA
ncbi:DUF2550 domain-containing protein [Streptomyces lunaelactis]|uniref:DUF2550 domain-containing protein n=1 Tax=Streptomyces lunaelactis TaxID=1535768 RepID=UPI001584538D|nr:DUF2550 domain-containing protein [Streptomyces lunaelactis]NUK02921.1 DUF2550 domain-containing protein [Streptomyces lunaelactis]NUK08903.1 DUF2550 domain-containing protein [Streptomyces lunaelactis]NUK17132.1 DUF2550 domain-containing protein [Streptomyces lunaelactis]NUK23110.1 DUF2550 domain-containing protein [Streptomyces lunaelactis]NUK35963.1 DUF2550 domain-containing protein [Streptomyces lunaelactis]